MAVSAETPTGRMGNAIRRLALGVAALTAVAGFTTAAVGAQPAAASDPQLLGTGSSFAFPAISQWQSDVSAFGLNINYQDSSSVIGLNEFATNQVDFGASEIGYSTGQADSVPHEAYQYLPDVSGGISFAYDLVGSDGQKITNLRLSPETLLGMFTDQITTWNAPQIQADNPGITDLPPTPIKLTYRDDACGENYILSYYFDYLFPSQWGSYVNRLHYTPLTAIYPVPQPPEVPFPNWVGQNGSDDAASFVQAQNGSITYVEAAWAIEDNLQMAYVENPSGNWVQPGYVNVATALTKAVLYPDLEENLTGVFTNPDAQSYPLSSYSYLVTSEGSMNPAKGAELSEFIYFLACQGQNQALQLGYAPIPPNLVEDDFEAGQRLSGHQPAPSLNGTDCKNPYVDGQIPLIGEPKQIGSTGTSGAGGAGTTATTTAGHSGGGSSPGPGNSTSGSSATTMPTAQTASSGSAAATLRTRAAAPHPVTGSKQPASGPGTAAATWPVNPKALASEVNVLRAGPGPELAMGVGLALLVGFVGVPPVVLRRRSHRRARDREHPESEGPSA